jgi:hypothetical protein
MKKTGWTAACLTLALAAIIMLAAGPGWAQPQNNGPQPGAKQGAPGVCTGQGPGAGICPANPGAGTRPRGGVNNPQGPRGPKGPRGGGANNPTASPANPPATNQ